MWELDCGPTPHEAKLLMLDCSKAIKRLDWSPRWGLESALTHTVEWHKCFLMQKNMRDCTVQQIVDYQYPQGARSE
jgi:CDP-glucose 4,6-dehydratase